MNRVLLLLAFVAVVCIGSTLDKSHNLAEVNELQGVKIFTDSRPVAEYTYLGTIKLTLAFTSGQYEPIRDLLIKKARKKYGNSFDGLILELRDGGTDKADVIKFKE